MAGRYMAGCCSSSYTIYWLEVSLVVEIGNPTPFVAVHHDALATL